MNSTTNAEDESKKPVETEEEKAAKAKQQQSDPNITELKGLFDPNEDLEVKGTDNHFKNP